MKRLLAAFGFSLAAYLPAYAALQAGDTAPDFKAEASLAGKAFSFSLKDALKKGPVVVYFYPSAYTGGCNIQAHTFAENMDKFKAAGATVIGVSLDSIARLNDFSSDPNYCASKLPVASDPKADIAKSFKIDVREGKPGLKDTRGAEIGHGFAERRTFVISPSGKIAATVSDVSPEENVLQTLGLVQKLSFGGQTRAR